MFKSIQTKIILILVAISLVMIIGTGLFYISRLEEARGSVEEQELINEDIEKTKTILIIVSVSYLAIRNCSYNFFIKNDFSSNCKINK
jgi:uncharacterized membrane protein YwzB